MVVEYSSKCCSDEGVMMEACGVLRVSSKNVARAQNAVGRSEEFFCAAAATRVGQWQKNALIFICLSSHYHMLIQV